MNRMNDSAVSPSPSKASDVPVLPADIASGRIYAPHGVLCGHALQVGDCLIVL